MDMQTVCSQRRRSSSPEGSTAPSGPFGPSAEPPVFIREAAGAKVIDAEGKEYIDYVASWGPMILGHSHPGGRRRPSGTQPAGGPATGRRPRSRSGWPSRLVAAFPSIEMVRMMSSGTEATMTAIRLARGYTGREKIIKFTGCYHGHADSLLVKAGSGVATLGIPGSPGIPRALAELTIPLPYNDSRAVRERRGPPRRRDLACIIVEPVAGNMGVVPPRPGFLETLREITRASGTLLIFDEVITGFRSPTAAGRP